MVQEIVDRPGWVSGNALAIIVKNAGTSTPPNLHRRVMAFERGGMQPGWHFARLVVTFSTTPPPGYNPQPVIPDPDHPHAVSEVQRPGGTDTYSYDDTGNLTTRTEAGTTYTQTTNAEGRLVRVEKTASGEVCVSCQPE